MIGASLSKEQMEEKAEFKKQLKGKNIEAVAQLLLDSREHNFKTQAELVDVKKMLTQANLDIATLKGEINALKAMGFRGNMGTGSTVHKAGE